MRNLRDIIGNYGESRELTGSYGKLQEITANCRKVTFNQSFLKLMGNHGKSWETAENHLISRDCEESREITGRNLVGGTSENSPMIPCSYDKINLDISE